MQLVGTAPHQTTCRLARSLPSPPRHLLYQSRCQAGLRRAAFTWVSPMDLCWSWPPLTPEPTPFEPWPAL